MQHPKIGCCMDLCPNPDSGMHLLMRSAHEWQQYAPAQCEKSPPVVLLPLQSRPLSPTVPSRSSPPWKALARSERLTAIETAVIADWHVQNTLFSCRVLRLWQDLVRQQHLEYEHARRTERAISSRMAPNRRRRWLRAALAGWTRVCEEERGRERDLELRLTCLRQLRVEFSKFDELSKANAFYTWFAEREKGRERERELDHRLKLLVGRFQDADKAAAFLPWSAATERRRLLFFKISRFVVRWQNKKMQPIFTTWQNMIQKMRALENSAANLLYRCILASFESWAEYSGYKAHLRHRAAKNASRIDRLLVQIHFQEWKRRTSKLEPLHYVQSFDDIECSWDRLFAQVGHRMI